ncbi:MAG: aldo/keto reductase, partial [bacterium]
RPGEPPPPGSRGASSARVRNRLSSETFALVSRLDDFARQRGHTAGELAIAWLTAQPHVSAMLLGMRTPEQVHENVNAAGWMLGADELQVLDGVVAACGLTEKVSSDPSVFLET